MIDSPRLRLAGILCLSAGILDVEAWMESLDGSRILNWWESFDRIHPLGNEAVDHMLSVQTAHIVSALTQKEKNPADCRSFVDPSSLVQNMDKQRSDEINQFA